MKRPAHCEDNGVVNATREAFFSRRCLSGFAQQSGRSLAAPLVAEPLDQDPSTSELELTDEPMLLNVGPAHPATHGTVRRSALHENVAAGLDWGI